MHERISRHFGRSGGRAAKKEIGIFFAELQFSKGAAEISAEWIARATSIIEFLKQKITSDLR
jgi:hypothetical protein